jgi:hypothetical protein
MPRCRRAHDDGGPADSVGSCWMTLDHLIESGLRVRLYEPNLSLLEFSATTHTLSSRRLLTCTCTISRHGRSIPCSNMWAPRRSTGHVGFLANIVLVVLLTRGCIDTLEAIRRERLPLIPGKRNRYPRRFPCRYVKLMIVVAESALI